jgi:signal transduction histidine kinase
MRMILSTSVAVLLLTCSVFFIYEVITFRKSSVRELSILGQIIATNCTAALAFDDVDAANETLLALKAERHIVSACLYDHDGKIFSRYPESLPDDQFPKPELKNSFSFKRSHLDGFQEVDLGKKRLGTLYLKSDIGALYDRLRLYGAISALVIVLSLMLAYILSKYLQQRISVPILELADTAKAISKQNDYSVRAVKKNDDELGLLTEAFNHMLNRIEEQTKALMESEAEIRSFSQKLEEMVAARTEELQVANHELESFSYSISHDLRAPLRSIHGYMNILVEEYEGKFDDEAKRLVNIILKNGQKMGQLIDDLLAFSRLGRKELTKSVVSMNDMVINILEESRRYANQALDIKILPLPTAHADNAIIRQVWVNLISNAVKYSRHKEKIIIEIGSKEDGDSLIYYVKDNGAGFDMRYYDKLFGVFQRLHSENEFEGTGVGLAIVQRIIFKHGGKVWATAKVNEGATFFFSLKKENKKNLPVDIAALKG